MKISHVRTQIIRLPADEPLAGGPAAPGATRDFVILKLGTDSGVEGVGLTWFGGAGPSTASRSPPTRAVT